MLDPITALSIAGNVVQFIDFGLKATSKAREIHRSATGALEENIDLEVVSTDLIAVLKNLEVQAGVTTGTDGLDDLCRRCTEAGNQLLAALTGFKVSGKKSKVKSARKALKSMWGKTRVEEMKKRLEGYRDEMQFHILVSLKLDIDAKAIIQSERFEGLDAYARAILEAISEENRSVAEAIRLEGVRSADCHRQSVETIIATQDEVHVNVTKVVNETGELMTQAVAANGEGIHTAISAESTKSDDRHRETTRIIIAKQDETHLGVTEMLHALDTASRAEQESTRRELEELKKAMQKIEQDMRRRDEELKDILTALSRTRNGVERKALREKSNAITVALVALMTIYEGLQQLIAALQSSAKHVMTSATLKIWGKRDEPGSGTITRRQMLDVITNQPSFGAEDLYDYLEHYSRWIDAMFRSNSCALRRTWDVEFYGYEAIDCENIILVSDAHYLLKLSFPIARGVCALASLFDSKTSKSLSSQNRETLKSLIILTSFLVECYEPQRVATIITEIFSAYPVDYEGPILDLGYERYSPRIRPVDILVWSTIGKIAGFQKAANKAINSRLQKWGTPQTLCGTRLQGKDDLDAMRNLLSWINMDAGGDLFSFSIGKPKPESDMALWGSIAGASRVLSGTLYALVEYLIEFGFPFRPPVIEVGLRGLVARVERKTGVDGMYTPSPQELEYAYYLISANENEESLDSSEPLTNSLS